jgi:hypothetical protein
MLPSYPDVSLDMATLTIKTRLSDSMGLPSVLKRFNLGLGLHQLSAGITMLDVDC